MPDQARRKQKQRLKRERKKAEARRASSISPYRRAGTGAVDSAYITADWADRGLALVTFVRRNPAGGFAMACFLVDTWCAGVKDAWGMLDAAREDVDRYIERSRERLDMNITRADPEDARRLVSAGVEFSKRNGFRLPDHVDRWIAVLGGLSGDIDDVSAKFGREGKLCWVGTQEQLSSRLIAQPVEEFLSRADVEYIIEVKPPADADEDLDGDAEDEFDDELEEDVEECVDQIERMSAVMATAVERRLSELGQAPPDVTADAVRLIFATACLRDAETCGDPTERLVKSTAAARVLGPIIGSPDDPKAQDQYKDATEIISPIVRQLHHELRIKESGAFDRLVEYAVGTGKA